MDKTFNLNFVEIINMEIWFSRLLYQGKQTQKKYQEDPKNGSELKPSEEWDMAYTGANQLYADTS